MQILHHSCLLLSHAYLESYSHPLWYKRSHLLLSHAYLECKPHLLWLKRPFPHQIEIYYLHAIKFRCIHLLKVAPPILGFIKLILINSLQMNLKLLFKIQKRKCWSKGKECVNYKLLPPKGGAFLKPPTLKNCFRADQSIYGRGLVDNAL